MFQLKCKKLKKKRLTNSDLNLNIYIYETFDKSKTITIIIEREMNSWESKKLRQELQMMIWTWI